MMARGPSSVSFAAAAWPREQWWIAVGDDQLNWFMIDAPNRQPGLRVAKARVMAAQAESGVAGAALYPQVNARATSIRWRFSQVGAVPPPTAGTWQTINDVALGVSCGFDFWSGHRAAMEAALDRAHATEFDLQAARLVLTTMLTRTYLRPDAACKPRDLAESTLQQREHALALTRRRAAAPIDSELQLTQVEAAMPAAVSATVHATLFR
jgi:outer membrane protein TolC